MNHSSWLQYTLKRMLRNPTGKCHHFLCLSKNGLKNFQIFKPCCPLALFEVSSSRVWRHDHMSLHTDIPSAPAVPQSVFSSSSLANSCRTKQVIHTDIFTNTVCVSTWMPSYLNWNAITFPRNLSGWQDVVGPSPRTILRQMMFILFLHSKYLLIPYRGRCPCWVTSGAWKPCLPSAGTKPPWYA